MKQLFLAICILFVGTVYAQITNNVELFGNSDFGDANLFTNGTSGFAGTAATDATIRGRWYAGATEITSYNVDGFMTTATGGFFDAMMPFDAALVYNNFLSQVPAEKFTTGRYRFSIKAKGTAPFYIKISSVGAMGTELGSIMRNPSSSAIVKQNTPDFNTYSIKVTPTEEWATYSADLDITLATNWVRVFIVFPKTGIISLDDISMKRTKDLPTTYYVRPSANTTAWSGLTGIDSDQIISTDAVTFAGTNTYYMMGGNYTTGSTIALTTGKIYGGFTGTETSINLNNRPTSDLDQNGIVEPWEFTNTTVITSSLANSKFEQPGVGSRLLSITGNGGEVDGVTFTDFCYNYVTGGITYGGPITLGQVSSSPTLNNADNVGKLTRCTLKKIKAGASVIMMTNNASSIDRCLIEDNIGTFSYGAVFMNRFGGILSNSVLRNNKAKTKGGAIFAGNAAATGGVDLKAVVSNCVIYNNTAEVSGAAICGEAGANLSGVEIVNSTIANNKVIAPGIASVELVNNGLLVNSIVVNDELDEIYVNNASNYVEKVVYGTLAAASATLYPAASNLSAKAIADLKFTNPTAFVGSLDAADVNYTTKYEALRKANFKISDATSVAYVSNATIPATYQVGGTGSTITTRATVPTTDILGLARSTNMTLGAYFYNPASAVENTLANKSFAFGLKNSILVNGSVGDVVTIYNASGQFIKSVKISADKTSIPSERGFYVVVLGTQKNKVAVN
jgi:predicted outer membrane repeat protein